jgi:hypothetical protein
VAANKMGLVNSVTSTLLWFNTMIPIEGVHPLEGGMIRQKFRRDRRPGLPIESPLQFYPRLLRDNIVKAGRYWSIYRRFRGIQKDVKAAPDRWSYTDLAIEPPRENEYQALDLYHKTMGGEAALARKLRDDAIRSRTGQKISGTVADAALARSNAV